MLDSMELSLKQVSCGKKKFYLFSINSHYNEDWEGFGGERVGYCPFDMGYMRTVAYTSTTGLGLLLIISKAQFKNLDR